MLMSGEVTLVRNSPLAPSAGGFYQPHHNNLQQNQFGGDTVIYDGQVLTNNLPPGENTCHWVEGFGLPCKYFYEQRNSTGYTTHYVGLPRSRWGRQNYPLHQQNPEWNNGGGGLCIKKQNSDGSFFQFGNC
jgi:hypothetical protein